MRRTDLRFGSYRRGKFHLVAFVARLSSSSRTRRSPSRGSPISSSSIRSPSLPMREQNARSCSPNRICWCATSRLLPFRTMALTANTATLRTSDPNARLAACVAITSLGRNALSMAPPVLPLQDARVRTHGGGTVSEVRGAKRAWRLGRLRCRLRQARDTPTGRYLNDASRPPPDPLERACLNDAHLLRWVLARKCKSFVGRPAQPRVEFLFPREKNRHPLVVDRRDE